MLHTEARFWLARKRLQPSAHCGEVEEALEQEKCLVVADGDAALLLELAQHALAVAAALVAA